MACSFLLVVQGQEMGRDAGGQARDSAVRREALFDGSCGAGMTGTNPRSFSQV